MKRTLLYDADEWGDDEPGTPSPRKKNMREFKELYNFTILFVGFACGYLLRSVLNPYNILHYNHHLSFAQ